MVEVSRYPVALGDPEVTGLDLLHIGAFLPAIWKMNTARDVNALTGLLRSVLPSPEFVTGIRPAECVATMRDLGLFLGSLKRCGVEPVAAIPELEALLQELGARTGMVPRDTVFHYTSWNPTGPYERMYTGHAMERMLIMSVRLALPRLVKAIDLCRQLEAIEPTEYAFAAGASELVSLVGSVEDAIDVTVANVDPQFFAHTMRSYFEPVRVGATDYLGPAAAHIPLYLIDLALWASDSSDETYTEFWQTMTVYGMPPWRQLGRRWANNPSLSTRITSALMSQPVGAPEPNLHASASAVLRALHALVAFRGKHLTLARRAYADGLRLYPLGSGGGTVQLLADITRLTRLNETVLRETMRPRSSARHEEAGP